VSETLAPTCDWASTMVCDSTTIDTIKTHLLIPKDAFGLFTVQWFYG